MLPRYRDDVAMLEQVELWAVFVYFGHGLTHEPHGV
jgi:hypothetical protein